VEDLRGALYAAGLTFDLSLAEGPLCVRGDPTRLSEAMGNVAAAARAAATSGSITG
jgi:hypothetical protein